MKSRYLPMLSKPADGPFNGDEWFFEIKWDGIRAIAYVGDPLSIRSRNDKEIAGQFPELEELTRLAPGTVLDGEIVAMSKGRPDIQSILPRLQSRGGRLPRRPTTAPITYIVFDILEKDGKTLTSLPLTERRKILENAVTESPHVVLSVPVEGRGEDYYRLAVAKGLEGVMAKRKDSRYEPGLRSGAWLKIKELKTCDCVIAGYTPGQGGRGPAFGALLLGLYGNRRAGERSVSQGNNSLTNLHSAPGPGPAGNLVYIGKVGGGFSDRDLDSLMDTFSKLKTGNAQLTGTEKGETVVWLEPVLVCEVAYQMVTREGKLRIPRFIRIRSDKKPEECTTDQLTEIMIQSSPGNDRKGTEKAAGEGAGNNLPAGQKEPEQQAPAASKKRKTRALSKGTAPAQSNKAKEPEGDSLKVYHEKRNFSVTSEPEGRPAMTGNYFVIHEHHSHHLHFDLRLERDGVLKSWAVPKGIPETPGEKHLAVAVEDHPLEYGHFEGTIPAGQYGAGTVSIWDNGTYETKHWDTDKIEIAFHGKRLTGHYVLVQFKRAGKNEWLVFKSGS
jgi:DNA ligase D-like protein (predicted 3'-phosphoesterase)